MKYPLMRNNIAREDLDAVIRHLQADDPILTNGREAAAFESEWSQWLGVKHSVFVNAGASANLLSMAVLKLRHPEGGEVIVPPLTWVSDIASVLQNGFTPVFADIDPRTLAMGTITCPASWERSRCLVKISDTLRTVILEHQPTVCVIEGIFYVQNLKTALIMGEARGAALAVIAGAGLDIYELATRKVKQAIVGYGAAQKSAVANMVQRMLNLAELPDPDAADALALALTHAREASRYQLKPLKKI